MLVRVFTYQTARRHIPEGRNLYIHCRENRRIKIKMYVGFEVTCSSETSVASQQTTRRHIPEDDTLLKIKL
jgi:hypothetical protein